MSELPQPIPLRSQEWFGKRGKDGFIYRAWMKNQGIPAHQFNNKPVIGICNTWSELTPCNAHFRELAQSVREGIIEAGGFPLEFPVMSLGESMMKPTAMLYRNLASMDTEESIRANPLDGVVILAGCDKTTPSTVMGACSVDIPTIVVSGGPMLTGMQRGQPISISDVWRLSERVKTGEVSTDEMEEAEACTCRSRGHCAVMGTASTMACMVEALGLTLPGNAAIPAADSRRKVLAHYSGMRIVGMVRENLLLSDLLTRQAFENAIRINTAIGGSTNFVIHLLAIAGRIGVDLRLDEFDDLARDIPLIVNLQPSGQYYMEDFFYAGGLPVVINQLLPRLHGGCRTANGLTIAENYGEVAKHPTDVITPVDNPVKAEGGLAVLTGNLCANGAVIKPSAASPHLLTHRGQAVVFETIEDYKVRINDPDLAVTETSVLVLKNVGPVGYPGMPEVGNMGLPEKLLRAGVTDMVRISDGRMSGTAFGTVVLHVSPEAAVGGTLALVETGDWIELDVPGRTLTLLVDEAELDHRRQQWQPLPLHMNRGYWHLYQTHVQQAHLGADLDFLRGHSGSIITRESH
ncbi:IlvD/Edd family dehydratase [Fibrella aquatilis]|uniref:Dihydroxy-acid dehydratase n=1 Tax=Fibrella aquatilis TaxID=2817059 RepID=A0A939K011_9BACT|nr:IlvD/Edd family dehydratase [Fibrella aquatilis]MBO0931988.1 dihydroxy-acid dehydratase [Fibrella aquatilis]